MRRRDLPHRRAADGRGDPQGDGGERLRPARVRAVRLRRRGPCACGRVRARARRAESRHPTTKSGLDVVRVRRRGGRRAAHLRAQRNHADTGAGEAHQRRAARSREKGEDPNGCRRHKTRPPALRVLARRAPPRADQRGRGGAAFRQAAGGLRGALAQDVHGQVREALRARLGARRRAARDRGGAPARASANTEAEANLQENASRGQFRLPPSASPARSTGRTWASFARLRCSTARSSRRETASRVQRSSRRPTRRWWSTRRPGFGWMRWATSS